LKIDSTITTPPNRYDRLNATALAIGPMVFGNTCRHTTRTGEAPLSTAISTYDELS
jgi:hypothetical protein